MRCRVTASRWSPRSRSSLSQPRSSPAPSRRPAPQHARPARRARASSRTRQRAERSRGPSGRGARRRTRCPSAPSSCERFPTPLQLCSTRPTLVFVFSVSHPRCSSSPSMPSFPRRGRHWRAVDRACCSSVPARQTARSCCLRGPSHDGRARTFSDAARRSSRGRDRARDNRHKQSNAGRYMHANARCYHRPCPVVCSVPVTGRTVTMPDGRARSRNTSRMQLLVGLRRSTPHLR